MNNTQYFKLIHCCSTYQITNNSSHRLSMSYTFPAICRWWVRLAETLPWQLTQLPLPQPLGDLANKEVARSLEVALRSRGSSCTRHCRQCSMRLAAFQVLLSRSDLAQYDIGYARFL